jgi:hypothetical protein
MDSNKLLLALAIVAVGVATLNVVVSFVNVNRLNSAMTGYVIDIEQGFVNITVLTGMDINLSRNRTINFGAGKVDTQGGYTNATLYTRGVQTVSATGWNATVPAGVKGFLLENIGNVNCTQLNISTVDTAATLFGSVSGTNQAYEWNVSFNETGSCIAAVSFNTWYTANTTNMTMCNNLSYDPTHNAVNIDIKLVVPNDAALTGALSDTINFVCWA